MTKLCSVCSTENRDEAQFCRACGTAFAPVEATGTDDDAPAAGVTCDECGFQNKPGIRYCANCGVSLLGTVIVPRSRAAGAAPPAADPYAGLSPPPISYPSFAPVPPYPSPPDATYPSRPAFQSTDAADYTPHGGRDPDPLNADDEAEASRQHEMEQAADATPVEATSRGSRTPILVAVLAFVLVAAGVAAWWALGTDSRAPASAASASAPVIATPAPVAPAPAPIPVEPAVTAAPPPALDASAPATAGGPAPTQPALPPAAAAPLPQVGDPPDADAEAKRLAAEKLRREKAARDKADRDAKAKLALEQRDREAAAARAEQEAQARRRAEEAARTRPVAAPAAPVAPAPASVQARGVREICAGRGTIAEAICHSRECGSAQHANEPICRQVREAEDRRRNYVN